MLSVAGAIIGLITTLDDRNANMREERFRFEPLGD